MTIAYPALLLATLLAGCKPPPEGRHFMIGSSADRGRAVIERTGCGSCHDIPGIGWPKGQIGPPLARFAEQRMIAGRLPNRPDILVEFLRNAPRFVPQTAMPPMPLTEEEARDAAAYLYALDGS